MKFKKIFSLSVAITATFVLSVGGLFKISDSGKNEQKTENFQPVGYQDLKIKTDTLHITNDNLNMLYQGPTVAVFLPQFNTINMVHYEYGDDLNKYAKKTCENRNALRPVYMRHEMEHARNANLSLNTTGLSRWDNVRVAIMDEVVARGGEIIEAQNYRLETGKSMPGSRLFLLHADSLIMARCKTVNHSNPVVNFSDSVIAGIVLKCAVDKFAQVCGQDYYPKRARNILAGRKNIPYTPNNQCKKSGLFFQPEFNRWGELFTYDVITMWRTNGHADIWNSASEQVRQYVVAKVDSMAKSYMLPGEMLNLLIFQKTH